MNFNISSKILGESLSKIQSLLGSNSIIQILNNCLFKVENGTLTCMTSDLENTMKVEMPVDSQDNFSIAVPLERIWDTIKNLHDEPLFFNINETNNNIELRAQTGSYNITGFDGSEFPEIREIEDAKSIMINSDALIKAFNTTLFAISNDDQRRAMTGVFCQFDKDGAIFVSTDAQKLVKYTRKDLNFEETISFIIPKKSITFLKQLLTPNQEIELRFNKSNCSFKIGNYYMICRLIDAVYPEYNNVISENNPNKIQIERELLINSIKRLVKLTSQTTYQISFKLSGSSLTLSANDLDFNSNGTETYTVQYSGEDMTISFNSKYLSEVLNAISTNEVTIEMSTPSRAGLIYPVDEDENEKTLMLLMPILPGVA